MGKIIFQSWDNFVLIYERDVEKSCIWLFHLPGHFKSLHMALAVLPISNTCVGTAAPEVFVIICFDVIRI